MQTRARTPLNAFSVDVEDWYQVADFDAVVPVRRLGPLRVARSPATPTRCLRLLDEAGVKGTFFVLTWNAERHPEVVRADPRGRPRDRLPRLRAPHRLRADAASSSAPTSSAPRRPSRTSPASPSSAIARRPSRSRAKSQWAPDVLLDLGFRYDSSVFPVKDSLYGMPDAERFPYVIRERDGRRLVEFPITTTELFGRNLPLGGGGYLRMLPVRLHEVGHAAGEPRRAARRRSSTSIPGRSIPTSRA